MLALYGCANHSIFDIGTTLRPHFKDSGVIIKMLGFDDSESVANIILVPTVDKFLIHQEMLEKAKAVVIIFDTPVLLEYLKPIEIIDVVSHKINSFTYRFQDIHVGEWVQQLRDKLDNKRHIKVLQEDIDVIPRLLGDTQSSILAPILNFLYSVPNTGARLRYQTVIYKWMRTQDTSEVLTKSLMKVLGKQDKVPIAIKRLIAFMDSEVGTTTREIISKIAKGKEDEKPVNYKMLCKKADISEFDIRYLLKAIRKSDSTQDMGDEGRDITEIFNQRKNKEA